MLTDEQKLHLTILEKPDAIPVPPYTFKEWGEGIKQLVELGCLEWGGLDEGPLLPTNEKTP